MDFSTPNLFYNGTHFNINAYEKLLEANTNTMCWSNKRWPAKEFHYFFYVILWAGCKRSYANMADAGADGPALSVSVIATAAPNPLPECEMDALLLGRTKVSAVDSLFDGVVFYVMCKRGPNSVMNIYIYIPTWTFYLCGPLDSLLQLIYCSNSVYKLYGRMAEVILWIM